MVMPAVLSSIHCPGALLCEHLFFPPRGPLSVEYSLLLVSSPSSGKDSHIRSDTHQTTADSTSSTFHQSPLQGAQRFSSNRTMVSSRERDGDQYPLFISPLAPATKTSSRTMPRLHGRRAGQSPPSARMPRTVEDSSTDARRALPHALHHGRQEREPRRKTKRLMPTVSLCSGP